MIGSTFTCNICNTRTEFNPLGDWREAPSCTTCGSSVRMRQLVHCLTEATTGRSATLRDSVDFHIKGLGLSDPTLLSSRLEQTFSYTNTYYHTEPQLDICAPSPAWAGSADFLISSDVFEHVPNPVGAAFAGAYAVLKPGGVFVLTVPFDDRVETTEHFSAVGPFRLIEFDGEWLLVGKTASNGFEVHRDLVFHGGPGTTVEMRFFGLDDLLAQLASAGFRDVKVHYESVPQYGIFPPHHQGLPITAIKPS